MDPYWRSVLLGSSLLTIKMYLTALWTSRSRLASSIHVSDEDGGHYGVKPLFRLAVLLPPRGKPMEKKEGQREVDRAMAAHRNDLENIPIFLCLALAFGMAITDPERRARGATAVTAFYLSRIAHTVVYLFIRRQPWRALLWIISLLSGTYLAVEGIMAAA